MLSERLLVSRNPNSGFSAIQHRLIKDTRTVPFIFLRRNPSNGGIGPAQMTTNEIRHRTPLQSPPLARCYLLPRWRGVCVRLQQSRKSASLRGALETMAPRTENRDSDALVNRKALGLRTITERGIQINRAPVLALWGTTLAERLGCNPDQVLSLGKPYAGLAAQSKGRRLGTFKPVPQ